jgi:twitching motility protein PilT
LQDLETLSPAIDAADSGLLVLGTMYTRTAVGTLTRIIDSFPADQQKRIRAGRCDTVRGVVAQVLCRRIGGDRVAAVESLVVDAEVARLLRENKTDEIVTAMKKGKAQSNMLLNEALAILVKEKQVDYQEAIARATDQKDLARRFENDYNKL